MDKHADRRKALPGFQVGGDGRSRSSGRLRAPHGGHEPSADFSESGIYGLGFGLKLAA